MFPTMTFTAALRQDLKVKPSRYHALEALEDASQPPAPPPASDPHPGTTAANFEIIAETVELIISMTTGERQTVARELAEHDWEMADAFAAMILDAGYDAKKVWGIADRVGHAEVTLADYVAGMVD